MKIKVIAFNKDIIDDVFDIQQKAYKPLFDKYMENDKAIVEFDLESFYKSFEFHIADDLLVEVFGRALTDMCLLKMTCLLAQSG